MDCRSKEVTGDLPAAWGAAGDLATEDFLGENQNSKTPQRPMAQRAMVRFKQRSEASPFSSNLNFRADFPAVPEEFLLIPYKMDIPPSFFNAISWRLGTERTSKPCVFRGVWDGGGSGD